ncbi:lysophosphatidic acid receptor 1-like [Melospiza georgiana]|uniref:lysophosphatidic acid receptor 1-like n=1 Tax=Melospiza georgiana TaxID=44398 RepID=UPI0025ACE6A6|nr:lysophosphatidic acid receptor 1-like [Melospiza georgiana]
MRVGNVLCSLGYPSNSWGLAQPPAGNPNIKKHSWLKFNPPGDDDVAAGAVCQERIRARGLGWELRGEWDEQSRPKGAFPTMNRFLNCSANHTKIWSHYLVLALGIPQLTINIVSIIFNCTAIFTRLATRDLHKPISILFCNLAVSDLFTSFSGFWISMLFITYPDITIFGSWDMLAPYSLYTTSILSTIYNLVSIGIERYLAVAESMRTRFRVARNHSVAVVFINWVLAFFLGCLPLMGWNCLHAQSNISVLYSPFCVNYLVFIAMPNVAMAFLVPLFTYLRIIIILRKRKLRMQACGQAMGTYRSAETQVARTSISIWLLALVSYAPFLAGVVFDAANRRCHGELYPGVYIFRNCTAILITLTCLGNPLLYTLRLRALGARLKALRGLWASRVRACTVDHV